MLDLQLEFHTTCFETTFSPYFLYLKSLPIFFSSGSSGGPSRLYMALQNVCASVCYYKVQCAWQRLPGEITRSALQWLKQGWLLQGRFQESPIQNANHTLRTGVKEDMDEYG
jgi:hypothetical protein